MVEKTYDKLKTFENKILFLEKELQEVCQGNDMLTQQNGKSRMQISELKTQLDTVNRHRDISKSKARETPTRSPIGTSHRSVDRHGDSKQEFSSSYLISHQGQLPQGNYIFCDQNIGYSVYVDDPSLHGPSDQHERSPLSAVDVRKRDKLHDLVANQKSKQH